MDIVVKSVDISYEADSKGTIVRFMNLMYRLTEIIMIVS